MPIDDMSYSRTDRVEVLAHAALCLLYAVGIAYVWREAWSLQPASVQFDNAFVAFAMAVAFYLNAFYLIPVFLRDRRWVAYGAGILVGMAVLVVGRAALQAAATPATLAVALRATVAELGDFSGSLTLAVMLSFAYRFTRDWIVNLRVIDRLRAENTAMELAFLKAQVDPHFLFNTLNTLYALALEEGGARTADSIARLGALMRYNLHDAQADRISLEKELAYLSHYVELQRLRLTEKTVVVYDERIDEKIASRYWIAPMLLLPYIENAFKHGVSTSVPTRIGITITIHEGALELEATNDVAPRADEGVASGVGLRNAGERLALLYPGAYEVNVASSAEHYRVHLSIQLQP